MTSLVEIGSRCCIVCGNPEFPSFEDEMTTFEICPICGRQSGYEYDTGTTQDHLISLRVDWLIKENGKWFHGTPPEGWSAIRQLNDAGLTVPEERA